VIVDTTESMVDSMRLPRSLIHEPRTQTTDTQRGEQLLHTAWCVCQVPCSATK
jgi:hypothetical protein